MYGVTPYADLPYVTIDPRRIGWDNNEGTIASDYFTVTTGGTVTESSTFAYQGTQSLRVNRTSAAALHGEPFVPENGRFIAGGYFWLRAATLPSGVGNTPIFSIRHVTGDNFEVTLSDTGQIKCRRQNNTSLVSGVESAASATTISTGAWYRVAWTYDASTGTASGSTFVNLDTPVTTSWTQAAEIMVAHRYGSTSFTTASTYDLYYDAGAVFNGTTIPWDGLSPPITYEAKWRAGLVVSQAVNRAGFY